MCPFSDCYNACRPSLVTHCSVSPCDLADTLVARSHFDATSAAQEHVSLSTVPQVLRSARLARSGTQCSLWRCRGRPVREGHTYIQRAGSQGTGRQQRRRQRGDWICTRLPLHEREGGRIARQDRSFLLPLTLLSFCKATMINVRQRSEAKSVCYTLCEHEITRYKGDAFTASAQYRTVLAEPYILACFPAEKRVLCVCRIRRYSGHVLVVVVVAAVSCST